MKNAILKITAILLVVCMSIPVAFAATVEDINQPDVFVKQSSGGTCTLMSTVMMLRRTAILMESPYWQDITEESLRSTVWRAGRGLPYEYNYYGIEVRHGRLPGGEQNRQVLIDILKEHPEGIVLYARGVPHAVLLCDYTDGVFYCSDPAKNIAWGRIPIDQAHGTRIENSRTYWYVSSPDVYTNEARFLKMQNDIQQTMSTETIINILRDELNGEQKNSESSSYQLFGYPLAEHF